MQAMSDSIRNPLLSKHKPSNIPQTDECVIFPLPSHPKKNQNYIRTAKYTLLTFLPLQFWFQFKKPYNLYFLLSALTGLSGASSLSPITLTVPLLIVFAFAAGKEAIEDYARSKSDKRANIESFTLVRNGLNTTVRSQDIARGDCIYIQKGISITNTHITAKAKRFPSMLYF